MPLRGVNANGTALNIGLSSKMSIAMSCYQDGDRRLTLREVGVGPFNPPGLLARVADSTLLGDVGWLFKSRGPSGPREWGWQATLTARRFRRIPGNTSAHLAGSISSPGRPTPTRSRCST